MHIKVETYSGYKADEYPKRFEKDGVMMDIVDIEDRWYDPQASYFRVFAADARRYILCMDNRSRLWNIKGSEA